MLANLISGAATLISLIALMLAYLAHRRSSRLARVAEVDFRVMSARRKDGKVTLKIVNEGHETALNVRIKPVSVMRVSVDGFTSWPRSMRGEVLTFSYIDTSPSLDSITLVWEGPGVHEQAAIIPSTSENP